ncbi:MAG: hypothetical protein FWD61_10165 [Phycisphaerales bacterium]|nr:hypothetical protein [Phycisphaerales bacterium]
MLQRSFVGVLMLLALVGCAQSYTVPGGPADFSKLGLTEQARLAATDASIRQALDKKPLVTFPATIAIARVQAGDYSSYNSPARPVGVYSVITVRDVEKDEDIEMIAKLPQVAGVATMKRILLDQTLNTDLELRAAAARLHANLLLYYTFDTVFETETKVRPLGVITLGLFPNKNAKVTSTASAVLMDVNNGYIYSVVEATSSDHQLTNAWESENTIDEVRRRTERDAFDQLLKQFKAEWPIVLATYNRPG